MNFLFVSCIIAAWMLISLFDIGIEANRIIIERKKWKKEKGGIKPMINWTRLAIRSIFLLIICVIVIYITPEIEALIKKLGGANV